MNNLEKRLKTRFPNEDLKVLNYKNARSEATVQCLKCGESYTLARAESFYCKNKKCVCQNCNNNHSGGRYDLSDIQIKTNQRYPKEHLQIITYSGMKNFAEVQCLDCGSKYFYTRAENLFSKNKQSVCKNCRPNKSDIIEEKRIKLKKYFDDKKTFILKTSLTNMHAHDLVAAECVFCHKTNYKTINDYLRGRGCACQTNNTKKTLKQFNEEIESDYEVLEYNGMEH